MWMWSSQVQVPLATNGEEKCFLGMHPTLQAQPKGRISCTPGNADDMQRLVSMAHLLMASFYGTDCNSSTVHLCYFNSNNTTITMHSMAALKRQCDYNAMNTLGNTKNTSKLHAPHCLPVRCITAGNVNLLLHISRYNSGRFSGLLQMISGLYSH